MQQDFRERQRKSYIMMRMVYDFTMSALILAMGAIMLFGDKMNSDFIKNIVLTLDPLIRYLFGGLCMLYGCFRLYRGIKHDY